MIYDFASYIMLLVSIIIVLIPRLVSKKYRTTGERQFFFEVFSWITIGGCLSAFMSAYSIFLNIHHRDALLLMCILTLISSFIYLIITIFSFSVFFKNIEIKEFELLIPSNLLEFTKYNPTIAIITHISDGHMPEIKTMEGEISAEDAFRYNYDALKRSASNKPREMCFVFHTGDVTDTGSDAEWLAFREACDRSGIDRDRLFIVPGNHDLSLETGVSPPVRNKTRAFEMRCANFVKHVLLDCPKSWRYVSGMKLKSIRSLLDDKGSSYLDVYNKFPPELDVLPAKPVSIVLLRASKEASDFVSKMETKSDWPTQDLLLCCDLLDLIFPIIFLETKHFIVIGLNSCSRGSMGIVDGAFGHIDNEQLDRLKLLLDHAGKKQILILVHHHVGVPARIEDHFSKRKETIQLRYLQLRNAKELLSAVKGRGVIIFHGHKHVGYQAEFDDVKVISAPSIIYGDTAGDRNPIGSYFVLMKAPAIIGHGSQFKPGLSPDALL